MAHAVKAVEQTASTSMDPGPRLPGAKEMNSRA